MTTGSFTPFFTTFTSGLDLFSKSIEPWPINWLGEIIISCSDKLVYIITSDLSFCRVLWQYTAGRAPSSSPSSRGCTFISEAGLTGRFTSSAWVVFLGIVTKCFEVKSRIGAPSLSIAKSWGGGFLTGEGGFSAGLLGVYVKERDLLFKLAINSWLSFEGLCIICALYGSKIGLRLFDVKKFIHIITGRDKFFKTTPEPEKMVDKLLNLILTSNCPTVSIVEFELAPFAKFKSDSNNSPTFPPKLSI